MPKSEIYWMMQRKVIIVCAMSCQNVPARMAVCKFIFSLKNVQNIYSLIPTFISTLKEFSIYFFDKYPETSPHLFEFTRAEEGIKE